MREKLKVNEDRLTVLRLELQICRPDVRDKEGSDCAAAERP